MRVQTLRRHENSHGDRFVKNARKIYEHPDPRADIATGLVEEYRSGGSKTEVEAQDDTPPAGAETTDQTD